MCRNHLGAWKASPSVDTTVMFSVLEHQGWWNWWRRIILSNHERRKSFFVANVATHSNFQAHLGPLFSGSHFNSFVTFTCRQAMFSTFCGCCISMPSVYSRWLSRGFGCPAVGKQGALPRQFDWLWSENEGRVCLCSRLLIPSWPKAL